MRRFSPKQMIEALKAVAALPGAEPHKPILLEVVGVLAEIVAATAAIRLKTDRLRSERRDLIASNVEAKVDA